MKNFFRDSKLGFKWWVANLAEILAMLESLYEKYPKAFFSERKKVKPLKIDIHNDIKIALKLKKKYNSKILEEAIAQTMTCLQMTGHRDWKKFN